MKCKATMLMAVCCALVFTLAFAVQALAQTEIFSASESYSETQGVGNWYYLDWTGDGYNSMTFGTNWWGTQTWHGNSSCRTGGIDSILTATGGHPNTCGYAPTRAWISPADGFVWITGNARKYDTGGGDGVEVDILHNQELLWSATIAHNDSVGYNFDFPITASAGDTFFFRIHQIGNPLYDTTHFDPTIALTMNIKAEIDIKPGIAPNGINPKSNGKIPVAILTTENFYATNVNPQTVLFGAAGTEAAAVQFAYEDIDGDGEYDMIFHFNTQETDILCGDSFASLTAKTFSGAEISGTDTFKTSGCR